MFGGHDDFLNILVNDRRVFCWECGGQVGDALYNGRIWIRSFRMVRVDPYLEISMCYGRTHDSCGLSIYHEHLSHMATIENSVMTPIAPVRFVSIQEGRILIEPCPYARNFLQQPPSTPVIQRFLDANRPRVDRPVFRSVQSDNVRTESVVEPLDLRVRRSANTTLRDRLTMRRNQRQSTTLANVPTQQQHSNISSFDDYLQDQPSTSRGRYSSRIENLRKKMKVGNHPYLKVVSNPKFLFPPFVVVFIKICLFM